MTASTTITTMTLGTVTIRFSRPVVTAISLIRARQKGTPK
jgi:hypothetical protein